MPDDELERGIARLADEARARAVSGDQDGLIDLNPREWKSGRAKRHEPILGPAAGYFVGELVVIAASLGFLILVALMGANLKEIAYTRLFGEQTKVTEPDYVWTRETGLIPFKHGRPSSP
jgi:hypothetical protein